MLKTISIVLLTMTLTFCPAYGADLKTDEKNLSSTAEAPHHDKWVTQPASVEELENFLRSNYGSEFPKPALSDFFSPFKSNAFKLDRRGELNLRSKAIEKLKEVISITEKSFLNVRRKHAVPLPGMPVKAVPRKEAIDHYYKETHRYFLTFQKMVSQTLDWAQKKVAFEKDAKDALTLTYGHSNVLGFAWLRDKNGIVPTVPDFSQKEVYLCHVPYGDWGDFNAGMVFVKKKLITERSIIVELFKEDGFLKITHQCGATNNFLTFPITHRVRLDIPFSQAIISTYFADNQKDIEAFILPETPNENAEFEAELLETMMEESQKSNPLAIAWLENYGTTLNSKVEELPDEVDPKEVERPPLRSSTNPIEAVQRRKDELYEKIICEELEARSRAAAYTVNQVNPVKKKTRGKIPQSPNSKAAAGDTDGNALKTKAKADELEAQKAEILSKLKTQGRQKWGGLINIIMSILTPCMDKLEFNTKGSHLNIHIKGQKESGGMTLITPHGRKGGEVPAGVARNLASQLFDLITKTSAE